MQNFWKNLGLFPKKHTTLQSCRSGAESKLEREEKEYESQCLRQQSEQETFGETGQRKNIY